MQTENFTLIKIFTAFAQTVGATIYQSALQQSVSYVNLESEALNDGYLRLCMAQEEDIFIIEVGLHLSSILPDSLDTIEKLMLLHILASPCQTRKRFFPTLDLPNQHFILSYVIGSNVIRHENDVFNLLDSCANEVAELRQSLRENLVQEKNKKTPTCNNHLSNNKPSANTHPLQRINAKSFLLAKSRT